MTDSSFPDALPAQYRLHWYVLERVLGQGGFGITYLARDSNLDKLVAIKEYLPVDTATRRADATVSPRGSTQSERYAAGLEGFIREARTLARFSHPNIVRVHSVFQHNNTAYMVMEYEEGETLAAMLERRQTLSERELQDVMLPIIDGLSLVHAAGFIHRDIKPENILIRKDSSPVLLDFGSARSGMGQSRTVTILVAPGYAPFEQYYANGESQGPWTDIYGLGATCYRAISGEPPLDAIARSKGVLGSTREMLVSATERGARRYSPQLLSAIDHALAFAERDRPQTLAQWRRELTEGADRQPVPPATPPVPSAAPAAAAIAVPSGPRKRELLAWAGVAALALVVFVLWQRSPPSDAEQRLALIERQLGSQRSASEPASAPQVSPPAAAAPATPVSAPVALPAAAPPVVAPSPASTLPALPAPVPSKISAKDAPKPANKPPVVTLTTPPRVVPSAAQISPLPPTPTVTAPVAQPVAPPVAVAAAPAPVPAAAASALAPVAPPSAVREEPRAVSGVPPTPPSDDKEAFAFYRARAQTGDAEAMFQLGDRYEKGRGVAQSNNQAYLWFGLSVCSGHAGARGRKALVAERLQPAELRVADRQVESIGKGCK